MRALAIVVLLGAGCSKLLGIDELHAYDAGVPIDAPAPDAPFGCDAGVAAVNVFEDTMLLDESGNPNPSIRHGADPIIDLGLNGTSRLLFRFDLSSAQPVVAALNATGGSITATLTIKVAMASNATTFQVFAASDGWNEGTGNYVGASWYQRIGISSGNQTPWQVPGADGASDRGMTVLGMHAVGAAETAAGSQIHATLMIDGAGRTDVAARLANNHMSLLLVPTAGGTLFVTARETQATATTLAFSLCP